MSCSGLPIVAERPIRCRSRLARSCDARQDGEEVPAPVVTGKGVQLIDDHGAKVSEKSPMLEASRHQHHLEGLRSREQEVRRLTTDPGPLAAHDIAMPDLDTSSDEPA